MDTLYTERSLYSVDQLMDMTEKLGKVGIEIGFPNWLFVASSRSHLMDMPTYNDVNEFLLDSFPENLPGESNAVAHWGCSDYIWQRIPGERCSGSAKEFIGLDFLILYAQMVK